MAQQALDEWATMMADAPADAIVMAGPLTTQDGGFRGPNGGNAKAALYGGVIQADVALPSDVPSPGEVVWPDGSSSTVELVSAARALDDLRDEASADAPCPECTPVHVIGVELVSHPFETARGRVRLPAWEFRLREGDLRVFRVAAAHVLPMPVRGAGSLSASWMAETNQLTVEFVGSPCSDTESCADDYTAEALESDVAVVVMVFDHRSVSGPTVSVGARRTATLTLDEPLDDRIVLNIFGAPARIQHTDTGAPTPTGSPCPAALTAGVLVEQNGGFFVDPDGIPGGASRRVIWQPWEYRVRADDGLLLIEDALGNVKAREGDYVRLGGGMNATDDAFVVCGPFEAGPTIGGANSTPVDLAVTINGTEVASLPRSSSIGLLGIAEPLPALPELPWLVEARTATGRALATLEVPTDYVPDVFVRSDLSCGAVMLFVGQGPVFGPAPPYYWPGETPGAPGDCEP